MVFPTKVKFPADLVTFTEEIFNGELHFWCSASLGRVKCTIIINLIMSYMALKYPSEFRVLCNTVGRMYDSPSIKVVEWTKDSI